MNYAFRFSGPVRWPILTLGPTPPGPGVRRGIMGMHLMGVHLMGVHLMGVRLMGVHLMGVYLMSIHLISLCLIPLGGKYGPPLNS